VIRRVIRRVPVWLLLAIAFVFGVVLIVVSAKYHFQWDYGVTHEVGIAFVVAAVLGGTIDFALKSAIARDVFEATLGHILRPEFRAEVSRITGYKFSCNRHVLLVELKQQPDHMVEVTSSIERMVTNITAYAEKQSSYLHIDEWGYPVGKSAILECRMIFKGERIDAQPIPAEPFREKWRTEEREIGPGESFTSFSKYREFKRENDAVYFFFGTPTQTPEMRFAFLTDSIALSDLEAPTLQLRTCNTPIGES
jgi:hypothetical protein